MSPLVDLILANPPFEVAESVMKILVLVSNYRKRSPPFPFHPPLGYSPLLNPSF